MDENQDTATTTADEVVEELPQGVDDPILLRAQLDREREARRQLTARAKDAETKLKNEREARIKSEEGITITNNKPTVTEDERLELRLDGYTKDEVDYIMQNGGRKVLADTNSYTAIAINTRREQLAAEKAASQTNQTSGEDRLQGINLSLPKQPTLKDMRSSIEQMEKLLPHANQ